jgi:transcriptional regulator with XRE-family HTH domain
MAELTQLKRIPIIRALTLMATESLSQEEAAKRSGISRATLTRALEDYPDLVTHTLDTILAEVKAPLRELFEDAMKARVTLITGFIQDAKDPDLPLRERIALDIHLKQEIVSLEKDMSLFPTEDEPLPLLPVSSEPGNAEKFLAQLGPPKLKRGKAVITRTETTTTFEIGDDKEDEEIIDVETT